MKRRIKRLLPFLATLLLLAAGLGLPGLTAAVVDRRLAQQVTLLEDAQVSLVLSAKRDLYGTLTLFRTRQTQISLAEGQAMTAAQAQRAAAAFRAELAALYLPGTRQETVPDAAEDGALLPQVTPTLVTGPGSPAPSGIFWRCVWEQAEGQDLLWLDDQTGQPVAFQMQLRGLTLAVTEEDGVKLSSYVIPQEEAVLTAEFLRQRYGLPEDQLAMEHSGWQNYSLFLRREQEEESQICALPLTLRGAWVSFNLD